jgi:cytidylate kinase
MTFNIAIDGPSGAGKSTIAKYIAKKLDILYLDTGAMYRAVAWYVISKGVDPGDEAKVIPMLDDIKMDIRYQNGAQRVLICGKDVTDYIREHNISMGASTVSKIPAVRLKLVELQREIAAKNDCVLDGRDIGSYVLPSAPLKIFLTAEPEERARRRHAELIAKGMQITYEKVLEDVLARDKQDSTRAFAPLKAMPDAIIIDTTSCSIQDTERKFDEILCKLKKPNQ